MVSIEKCRCEQEIDVLREGADLRRHLSTIPHCRTRAVVLVPGVQHLVAILTDKGVSLQDQSSL